MLYLPRVQVPLIWLYPPFLTFLGCTTPCRWTTSVMARRDLPPVPPLAPAQGEHCPCAGKESGQGRAEMEAAAEAGEGRGGVHHSTTALSNFGTAQYCVFRVAVLCWDQYLAHPSYRHCKTCQGYPNFVSQTKRERRGAAQVTLVGGEFAVVPAHARDTVERAIKKKLLSSSVSQESFTTRKLV